MDAYVVSGYISASFVLYSEGYSRACIVLAALSHSLLSLLVLAFICPLARWLVRLFLHEHHEFSTIDGLIMPPTPKCMTIVYILNGHMRWK